MRRDELDAAVREAVQRTKLAIGEIVYRDRMKDGIVVDRRVANPEAIERATQVYGKAQQLLGRARQLDGTTEGAQQEDRPFIRNAHLRMMDLWREIEAARVLAEK
jgi:hypothetical protein